MVEQGDAYATSVGDRLRRVRVQQNLSLHDVERLSDGTFKASVVGAYERGERSISVARLRGLADFYRVPLTELVPTQGGPPAPATDELSGTLTVDLTRLEGAEQPETGVLNRFVHAIQVRRGDYNGRVITIRRDDLRALAAVLELSASEYRERLVAAGVIA